MGLAFVDALCVHDGVKGTAVLESDNTDFPRAIEELQSPEVRKLAITKLAQMGLSDPRICGSVRPYPIDAEGNEVQDALKQKVVRYRCAVPLTHRLI